MVEVTGLEPTTSWSLTKRATKLRYTSDAVKQHILLYIFFRKCKTILAINHKFFIEFSFTEQIEEWQGVANIAISRYSVRKGLRKKQMYFYFFE